MPDSLPPTPRQINRPPAPSAKTYPGFPLTAHPTRRWCKRVRGKLHYFGPLTDPDAALRRWLAEKDDLLAGREPQQPTTANRRRPGRPRRFKKPRPDYPLSIHSSGRWFRKVRGRFYYFGKITDDPNGERAEAEWNRVQADLYAGRVPRPPQDGLTVKDACNLFLKAKRHRVDTHELTYRQWHEYFRTFQLLLSHFGQSRLLTDLRPEDFAHLRAHFARGHGLEYVGNNVQRVRSLLKWLWENDHIDKPVKVGSEFKRPGSTARRKARQARPKRVFSAREIRMLLDLATGPMKAMIYLGINCGFGNSDCAALPARALDLEKGILDFPRPKTAIDRRATLWPETVEALKGAIEKRPTPKDKAHAGLVFITKYGVPWVRYADEKAKPVEGQKQTPHGANINAVGLEFGKLLRKANIQREGVAFYALRHTFETIAGETGDQPAVNRIMGHADATMAGIYREWLRDERENARLRRVTDHVHAWLYAEKAVDNAMGTKVD